MEPGGSTSVSCGILLRYPAWRRPMSLRRFLGVLLVVLAVASGDLLACGDKFLVAGRGTRYQRPKNARAASVLIYADPASATAATIKKAKVESLLKLEGHRATRVQSLTELSTVV